jgi:hemoglobin
MARCGSGRIASLDPSGRTWPADESSRSIRYRLYNEERSIVGGRTSLFEAIGGAPVVAKVVDEFYLRVLGNARLAAFFAHTDLDELKRHQREFLALALHGPDQYSGRSMREAHEGRGITASDFDRMLFHFSEAFTVAGVPERMVAKALAVVEPYRSDIVGA